MKDFDYQAPRSLETALGVLAGLNGRRVRPLAGGTDLIDQIRQGRQHPDVVLDIKRIPEMRGISYDEKNGLKVGAAASCTDVAGHPAIQKRYPAIAESCRLIGSTQIQNRASVGGNVCNAAPSADSAPSLLIYEAWGISIGPNGRRQIPMDQFFTGPGQTLLADDELLVEIRLLSPSEHSASHYLRFVPREEMDIAVAGVASMLSLDARSGHCLKARIALASVAPTPIRAPEAERCLEGKIIGTQELVQASEWAADASRPISDIRGSAEYRRELVKALTHRTLSACLKDLIG